MLQIDPFGTRNRPERTQNGPKTAFRKLTKKKRGGPGRAEGAPRAQREGPAALQAADSTRTRTN